MEAVLFDFNGTLYDDTRFHLQAWSAFLNREHGFHYSQEEIYRICIGQNNADIISGVFNTDDDELIWKYALEKESLYRQIAGATEETRRLIDGAPEMLDMLKERGIPFALATASVLENVKFYMDKLGLNRWFTMDRIVYDSGEYPSKPDPAYYIEAARRLGVSPGGCMIVEDSLYGIQGAASAKCRRIIAMDRTTKREVLESNPAVYAVIHDYRGFERFL